MSPISDIAAVAPTFNVLSYDAVWAEHRTYQPSQADALRVMPRTRVCMHLLDFVTINKVNMFNTFNVLTITTLNKLIGFIIWKDMYCMQVEKN